MPRPDAAAASAVIGSTTPWAYEGADPTTSTVESSSAAVVAATSARKSSPAGTTTVRNPK
jgi:hypothetical protein